MVADDIGYGLPPHDHNTGELLEEITLAFKPASIMPALMVWKEITCVREAHHARIEAAKEAKREARRRENERTTKLAALTSDDMPEIPPFLQRAARTGT